MALVGLIMANTKNNSDINSSIDLIELDKFKAMAEEWWDPEGKFKPLHKFNPVRLEYIRNNCCDYFNLDKTSLTPLTGLSVLDIGCGGGLLCEPLARLGANVTGIDVLSRNIEIAKIHADSSFLSLDYRQITIEELSKENLEFDIVLNMEVVEHVINVQSFLISCGTAVKKEGLMFFSTLNRTAKAFALAIIGGEYILGWLPRGTHDWKKFVRPSEFDSALMVAGISVTELTGVTYNPLSDTWSLNKTNLDVNYMGFGKKLT